MYARLAQDLCTRIEKVYSTYMEPYILISCQVAMYAQKIPHLARLKSDKKIPAQRFRIFYHHSQKNYYKK